MIWREAGLLTGEHTMEESRTRKQNYIYNNNQLITLRAMPITEGDDHYLKALHKMVLESYMYLTRGNIKSHRIRRYEKTRRLLGKKKKRQWTLNFMSKQIFLSYWRIKLDNSERQNCSSMTEGNKSHGKLTPTPKKVMLQPYTSLLCRSSWGMIQSRNTVWLLLLGLNYYRVWSLLTQVFALDYQASRQGQLQKSSNFYSQLKTWGEGGISAKSLTTIICQVMHVFRTTTNYLFGLST